MEDFFMRITPEEKLKYVKMHLEENVPIFELKRKYGIDDSRLKYYCQLYLIWGEKAFKLDTQRRGYTRKMKLEAINDCIKNGVSYRRKALELMLTEPGIVADWVKLYKTKGEEAIKDTYSREAYKHHNEKVLEKEYKKLLEDLERTKAENEYLKKSFPLSLERSKQFKKK